MASRTSLPVVSSHAPALPALAASWLDALLAEPLPREPRSTCDDCAMAPPEGEPYGPAYFHADTKCCTYHPALVNFLVGGVLSDPSLAEGAARVRARIEARAGVHPLGIDRDPAFAALYRASHGEVFGRARSLTCPFYLRDHGTCSIWRHRNGVCATWHCKHSRGAVGARVWRLTRTLLAVLERQLSWWAARAAGLPLDTLAASFAPDEGLLAEPTPVTPDGLDARANASEYALRWGPFEGDEERFYRECYAQVSALSFSEVLSHAGAEARSLADLLVSATQGEEPPPSNALLRSLKSAPGPLPETLLVESYSPYDPLVLPAALVHALTAFDGRPLDEARAMVLARSGVSVDDELLVRLCDFGVLLAVP